MDRDRDRDRDFRNPRDRFERDDRRFDRDRVFSRRDMDDRGQVSGLLQCYIPEIKLLSTYLVQVPSYSYQ